MKIYLQQNYDWLKIMKCTMIQLGIAILFTGVSLAEKTHAQAVLNRPVSILIENTQLSSALDKLEKNADVKFVYSKNVVRIDQKVSIQAQGEKLGTVLDKLLNSNGIAYEVFDNRIVLSKKNIEAGSGNEVLQHPADAEAQIAVSGRVSDSGGAPLAGVTVTVKGTTTGAITDMNGQYSINVPDNATTLVFKYIGYTTQEVAISGRKTVNIQLVEDPRSLGEVVVIGYGTAKKSSVTAAISRVDNKMLDQVPAGRAETALVGRMAGVSVSTVRSRPGEAPVIRIRGASSLDAGNDPLVVIDGFPGASFDNVNMNDVESVEVLKDASSSAIYGSRGSGGVIIVTTKKGKTGKPQLNFNAYGGAAVPIVHNDWISGQEYYDYVVRYQNREYVWVGGDPTIPVWNDARRPAAYQVNPIIKEGNVNWQNEVLQDAPIQNYNLAVSGGSENAKYYVSGTYRNEQGTIKNSFYKNYSVRANVDLKVNSVIDVGFMLNPNFNKRRATGSGIEAMAKYPPFTAVQNPDGSYPKARDYWGVVVTGGINPMAILNATQNYTSAMNNIGEGYMSLNILKGLKLKSSVGTNMTYVVGENYQAAFGNAAAQASGSELDTRRVNLLNENILSYNATFAKNHHFGGILGASYQKETLRTTALGTVAGSYLNDVIKTVNNGTINTAPTATYVTQTSWGLASYFGRVTYDYKEKYLLSGSLRTDGSSRFAPNNKWGFFPSASIAWRVTEEDFLKDHKVISNLKLRSSYGETGNFNIANFGYLGTLRDALYAPNGTLTKGQYQENFENLDLAWEQNQSYDIGAELGLFNGRINLTADYYNKRTTHLLIQEQLPATTGFTTSLRNTGAVNNRGIELEISTRNLTGPLKWNTSLNYTRNRNKVVSLGGQQERIAYTDTYGMAWILRVGEPMFSYYGFKAIGVLQNAADVANSPIMPGSLPGNTKYQDVVPDGVIAASDRVVLGSFMPKYNFGITNDFSWKKFDLSFILQGSVGAKMYNFENEYYQGALAGAMRRSLVATQWWSQAEPGDGRMPGAALSKLTYQANNDIYLENASFVALRNVNLGYSLPNGLVKRLGMKNCRVYTSVNNLFVLTKNEFHGYNPEGYTFGEISGLGSRPGYNGGSDPISRIFTLGLNANF